MGHYFSTTTFCPHGTAIYYRYFQTRDTNLVPQPSPSTEQLSTTDLSKHRTLIQYQNLLQTRDTNLVSKPSPNTGHQCSTKTFSKHGTLIQYHNLLPTWSTRLLLFTRDTQVTIPLQNISLLQRSTLNTKPSLQLRHSPNNTGYQFTSMCRWFLCGIHTVGNGTKHQQSYLILKLHFIKYTYYFDINIKRVTPMILYLYLMSSLYFYLSQLITCRNICILKF